MHILRCMGSKFCVKFQRAPLKFHTKFWTHTPQNVHFTIFIFCVRVTISLNCDVISLSETGPRHHDNSWVLMWIVDANLLIFFSIKAQSCVPPAYSFYTGNKMWYSFKGEHTHGAERPFPFPLFMITPHRELIWQQERGRWLMCTFVFSVCAFVEGAEASDFMAPSAQ